jgi:hypothetical protein
VRSILKVKKLFKMHWIQLGREELRLSSLIDFLPSVMQTKSLLFHKVFMVTIHSNKKKGGVAEMGNHEELMKKGGIYYELVTLQSTKKAEEDEEKLKEKQTKEIQNSDLILDEKEKIEVKNYQVTRYQYLYRKKKNYLKFRISGC